MEQKQPSQKALRQRKFLLALPLLVFPFLTLMFWALGGGKGSSAVAQDQQKGFNMQLPGANLKDEKALDKLSYYDKAASDSLKMEQLMRNDPNYRASGDTGIPLQLLDTTLPGRKYSGYNSTARPFDSKGYTDPNEENVYRKLAELDSALNSSAVQATDSKGNKEQPSATAVAAVSGNDVDRLEQMMLAMNQKDGADPEMKQLGGMLESILDIQHPERVQERTRKASASSKGQVFPVASANRKDGVTMLDNRSITTADSGKQLVNRQNGFFSIGYVKGWMEQNSIEAAIHETQVLVNGSTVKLRLVNDIYINGVMVPRNSFIYGTAQLSGERLGIKVNSIRYGSSIFPVSLMVYDLDGMDGIYIPGAISRDVAKESADRSLQGIGYSTLDPSLGAQAASAGIEAAKTLFSKKVKLIKVTVRAGYRVLLQDEKQRQALKD